MQPTSPTPRDALDAAIRRYESGDRNGAIAACRALAQQRPGDDCLAETYALMLLNDGRLEEGVAALDTVLAGRPHDAAARANRGTALLRLGRLDEAASDLQRAIAENPKEAQAWLSLSTLQRRREDTEAALKVLENAARQLPDNPAIAASRAALVAEHGDAAEAVALLEPLVARAPDNVALAYNLGTALHRVGRLDEAEARLVHATTLDPSFAPAWRNLANTRLDRGDTPGGMAALDRLAVLERGLDRRAAPDDRNFSMTSRTKLEHDIEQLRHLRSRAVLGPEWDATIAGYGLALAALDTPEADTGMVPLPPAAAPIRASYNRLIHKDPGARLDGPAISPAFDGAAAEAMYRERDPGIAWGDGLLTPEALQALRRFCLESTIWFQFRYGNGYLGAFQDQGFCCPLLAQIADELRRAMPNVVGPHTLRQTWAFKYDHRLSGIRMHADAAAVNVNFWLTPDEANLDPEGGGLEVWDKEAPLDWDFARYNRDTPAVRRFLDEQGAKAIVVPHRQNRAVLFNSDLFHETGSLSFRPGYENRRINVTMLFGKRGD